MSPAAEYPPATYVPAHWTNLHQSQRQRSDIAHIIIHITDGHANAGPVAQMWTEPGHGSSAHFVIGQDGHVIQSVLLKDVAYHAHRANRLGIGIEHCARTPHELGQDDPGLPVSEAQYQASAELVAWLCVQCGLSPTRDVIVGHAEIDDVTTHRDCPNSIWGWEYYLGKVVAVYRAMQG